MPRPRPPHIQREVTRHGRVMWYFRRVKGGPRVRLPDTYGSQEFWEAYRSALAGEQPRVNAPARGSLSWLIEEYKRSSKWRELGPSTQRVRDRLLARVAAKAGHVMARQITRIAVAPSDLTDWRERHALTKVELARLLGVQPLAVSRWENGSRSIPAFLELALKEIERRFTD